MNCAPHNGLGHEEGPAFRLERIDGGGALDNGRELVKVADEEELEAAKGSRVPTEVLADEVEFFQKVGRQHADFVDNQEVGGGPVLLGTAVPSDARNEVADRLFAEPDAGPGMKCLGLVAALEEKRGAAREGRDADALGKGLLDDTNEV